MAIEFIDGYVVFDGIKSRITENDWNAGQPGRDRIGRIQRIGEAVLKNLDKYPEFRDI